MDDKEKEKEKFRNQLFDPKIIWDLQNALNRLKIKRICFETKYPYKVNYTYEDLYDLKKPPTT